MMSAKVGTGLVAEIGAMRISDEIDALEVMGINSLVFLCATRLLGAWLVLPAIYVGAVGAGFLASYVAIVQQIGEVSSGGYFLIFWMFQNPPDLLFSLVKAMAMATVIVLVGCYYGYNASGRPGGRGHRHRQVDGAEHRARPPRRDGGHADLLGLEPESADRRMIGAGLLDLAAAQGGPAARRPRAATSAARWRVWSASCTRARVLHVAAHRPDGRERGRRRRATALAGRARVAPGRARGTRWPRTRRELGERLAAEEQQPAPDGGDAGRPGGASAGCASRTRDIGEPGCRDWHVRPRFGLLGMLAGWWRVVVSSGCPLQPEGCSALD